MISERGVHHRYVSSGRELGVSNVELIAGYRVIDRVGKKVYMSPSPTSSAERLSSRSAVERMRCVTKYLSSIISRPSGMPNLRDALTSTSIKRYIDRLTAKKACHPNR